MKIRNLSLTVVIALAFSFVSYAQPYKTAIGVRLGFPNNVNFTLKHNLGTAWAIELNAGAGWRSAAIDFAGMYHFDIPKPSGMRWYLGAAADVGFFYNRGTYHPVSGYKHGYFSTGVSIFGGLEYTFPNIPLNLAFDLGPRLPIVPWSVYPDYARVGLTARYTFK